MTVALNTDIALLDAADAQVAAFLKLPVGSDALITLINEASAECEAYCNRPLKAREFAAIRLAGQCMPELRRPYGTPIDVDARVTLSLDGVALTIWRKESDGDPRDFDVQVGEDRSYFYRADGWLGTSRPFPILVSFTGGLEPIPADLQHACKLVCQQFARQEKGQTDVQSYGPGPVSQSITYGRPDSLIPLGAQRVLDRAYRVVPL